MGEVATTRVRVEELRAQGFRPAEIARKVGVSRQRVYEILGRVPWPLPTCVRCGSEFKRTKGSHTICQSCHETIYRERRVTLVCPQCGQSFSLSQSDYKCRLDQREQRGSSTEIFHSRQCSVDWHKERTR